MKNIEIRFCKGENIGGNCCYPDKSCDKNCEVVVSESPVAVDGGNLFDIILTSVGVELTAFKYATNKISDEDDNELTNKITKRLLEKLSQYSGRDARVKEDGSFLKVLEENYEACKELTEADKKRPAQEIVNETYEDLIGIYRAKYLNT